MFARSAIRSRRKPADGYSAYAFGLLSGIFFFSVFWLLLQAPLTFDFSRWYAPYGAATLALVLLLALFAFKTALGSRKLFKTDLFED
jgi:multidrug transporter EmrE-like cation transporter